MAAPLSPHPVKFIVAVLWKDGRAFELGTVLMKQAWGDIDYQGPDHPFESTPYYDSEMGPGLLRRLVAFGDLRTPDELVVAKLRCNEIENELAGPSGRRLNLDIGYLDHNKIVLASAKGLGQKIYLSKGIYADLVARYGQGRYQPFEWTFPDFKAGLYDDELEVIRKKYLEQCRELRSK